MTREELAVQVAQKIWGWERNEYGNWAEPDGSETYIIDSSSDDLERFTFSWEGFGRTVEAMRVKGNLGDFDRRVRVMISRLLNELNDKSEFFEATHRAALEAIGDE